MSLVEKALAIGGSILNSAESLETAHSAGGSMVLTDIAPPAALSWLYGCCS